MPNHVESSITIYGKEKDLYKIKEEIKGEEPNQHLSFNSVIPMPDEVFRGNVGADEQKKYGKNNWYDWSCENWGTKWDAYEQPDKEPQVLGEANSLKYIKDSDPLAVITYSFLTAWSPIPKVLEALSIKYPSCIFKYAYSEESGEFSGIDFWYQGDLVREKQLKPKNQIYYIPEKEKLMREFKALKIKIP